ncbi:MAG TPA: nitronate monooxygenase [Baekduia sp.]|nr:nitronate monooxygenase [Baekduia sp.]
MIELDVPVVLAPMAGGPSTPALAAAVSEAGGLGLLATGYRSAAQAAGDLREARARTRRPLGLGVFVPQPAPQPSVAGEVETYARRVAPEAARLGAALGEPRHDDDDWEAKVELAVRERPAVVLFAFGLPGPGVLRRLRDARVASWVTVNHPDEARAAQAAGADVLVVQGAEAGGHRGGSADDGEELGLLALLRLVRRAVDLPLVAAGAIADRDGVAAALRAGATAAQAGTAFLRCPEAGTTPAHREAVASARPTALTRAFSGRRARGIVNRFLLEHDAHAPAAYPEVHHLTAPLRAAARAAGAGDAFNLWAGQAHALAREAPAAAVVADLTPSGR